MCKTFIDVKLEIREPREVIHIGKKSITYYPAMSYVKSKKFSSTP